MRIYRRNIKMRDTAFGVFSDTVGAPLFAFIDEKLTAADALRVDVFYSSRATVKIPCLLLAFAEGDRNDR